MPVDVSQINALAASLAKAGAVAPVAARAVVSQQGKAVQRDAQSRAAVLTGELRGSITAQVSGLTAVVSASSEHAVFNEFGTSRMAPQPFMAPAVDTAEQPFVAAMEKIAQVF